MEARKMSEPLKNQTTVERKSDREVVVTRLFNGPARLVFDAWTKPELMKRWWVPKSATGMSMLSCEMDVRIGGSYRLVFSHPAFPAPMAVFGTYTEVIAPARLVWTNDEGDSGQSITTVTFEEKDGKTLVVVHELHPSKEALDAHLASGAMEGAVEMHDQLDELLLTLLAG
jgi:uncharacterized protein YndB with AHSA1/START domain